MDRASSATRITTLEELIQDIISKLGVPVPLDVLVSYLTSKNIPTAMVSSAVLHLLDRGQLVMDDSHLMVAA